ncbi:hypothetical protein [Kamptonema formosum]|uniref:hypothetical protein n=1 Tax=Kamptonema formosum TaxID=331992 RepID=UPI0003472D74|nr:hypothetical protein [Oscillatoria sp. PCC 10802]
MSETSHSDLTAERIESLKAGTLAALALLLAFGAIAAASQLLLTKRFDALAGVLVPPTDLKLPVSLAIAGLSGFLFGVTYRYAIRTDSNPQLKAGAVLAFGLVRGLAQLDVGLSASSDFWPFAVLGVESVLLFAAAGTALDWALARGWVRPFSSK